MNEPTSEERLDALRQRDDAPVTRREARLRRGLPLRSKVLLGSLSGVGFTASALAMGPVFADATDVEAADAGADVTPESTTTAPPHTEAPTTTAPTIEVRPNYVYVDENGEPLSEAEVAARLAAIDQALAEAGTTTTEAPSSPATTLPAAASSSTTAAPVPAPAPSTTAAPAVPAPPPAPVPTTEAPSPQPPPPQGGRS